MIKRLKRLIKDAVKVADSLDMDDSLDITADIARANCREFQSKLAETKIKEQEKLREKVCLRIKTASKEGRTSVRTVDLFDDFVTEEVTVGLKEFFEKRGFRVDVTPLQTGSSWIEISWE